MRLNPLLFVPSFALASLAPQAREAIAALPGIVTVPIAACAVGEFKTLLTNGFICPYTANSNGYSAMSVSNIYVDYVTQDTTGHTFADACVQSWTGGSEMCTTPTNTDAVGNYDVSIPAFSTISGASNSPWNYYFVEVFEGEFVIDPNYQQGLGVPIGNPPGSPTRFLGVGFN